MVQILMRASLAEEEEKKAATEVFGDDVVDLRSKLKHTTFIGNDNIVIGRYSVLPYYQELEQDLKPKFLRLVNSFSQHRYVADLQNWFGDFEDITPKTWFRLVDVPQNEPGSFFLKGETNSRKHLWNTHSFAPDRSKVMQVACRLMDDSLIGSQNIYVRQFEEFENFGESTNGLPISNEWRVFSLNGNIVDCGWYWSDHPELAGTIDKQLEMGPPFSFIQNIADRLKDKIPFACFDVAKRKDGRWRLVELNDGQMSGISCIDPLNFYQRLKNIVEKM